MKLAVTLFIRFYLDSMTRNVRFETAEYLILQVKNGVFHFGVSLQCGLLGCLVLVVFWLHTNVL